MSSRSFEFVKLCFFSFIGLDCNYLKFLRRSGSIWRKGWMVFIGDSLTVNHIILINLFLRGLCECGNGG